MKDTNVTKKRSGIKKFLYRYSNTLIAAGIIVVVLAGGACAVMFSHNNKKKAEVANAQVQQEMLEQTTESAEEASQRAAKEAKMRELLGNLETSYTNFRVVFDVYTDSDTAKACVDDLIANINPFISMTSTDSSNPVSNTDSNNSNNSSKKQYINDSQKDVINQISNKDGNSLVFSDFKTLNTIASHLLETLEGADTYQTLVASLDEVPDFEVYTNALNEKIAAEEAAAAQAAAEAAAAEKAAAEAANSKVADDGSNANVAEEDEHANDDVSDGTDKVPMVLTSNMSFGVDVSHYQSDHGAIDWKKVKDSGISFAIIKCGGRSIGSDGKLYKDPAFEQNIVGALANGIQVGIYFFSQARNTNEAAAEADYCLSLIQKYKITYPVAFDWESGKNYRVNKTNISNQQLTKICTTFADKIAAAGYTPMVYFCKNDWLGRVDGASLTKKYKTWLAYYFKDYYYTERQWKPGDDGPEFDYNYDIWQYGVTNTVPGINYYTDMNVAMFSYDNYTIDLYEPYISLDSDTITVPYGKASAFLDQCHAINCIGVDNSVNVVIDGKKYTTKDKINRISYGNHKVKIYFNDPLYGTITKEFTINVSSNVSGSNASTTTKTTAASDD